MCYSTCSFNPIENESVVMELLRRCDGALEIVDVSDKLPGLIRRPGLSTWKVWDTVADDWATPDQEGVQDGTHKFLKPSMFPPTEAEVQRFNLQRCMRIVPHAQDTGGFFITLLHKTGETHGVRNPAAWARMQASEAATAAAAASGVTPDPLLTSAEEDADSNLAQSVLAELPDLDGDGGAPLPAGLDDAEGSKGQKQAAKAKAEQPKKFNEDPFEPMNPEVVAKIM